MKNLRLLKLLIFAIVAFLLSTTASFAYDFKVDGIYYLILSESDNTVCVIHGDYTYSGSIVIPSTVTPYLNHTYTVTSIGNSAFKSCSGLTSVTIPNSVTNIGWMAFYNCRNLKSVTIGNSVTSIEQYAFQLCSGLTEVAIPNSVMWIGDYAFSDCSGLTSITIPNSVTSIGPYAFSDCSGLTEVNFYAENCTSMGGAYYSVFTRCKKIKTLNIGNSVKTIPNNAFLGCTGLTEVNITDLSAWCKIDFHNEYSNPLYFAENLKLNGKEVTDLVIPDGITAIKSYAFYYCSGLTSVTIPNSVTSIGEEAFYNCSGLTEVTIGNSVTKIGDWAFYYCRGLTSVTIPNSVTKIGDWAFRSCSGLTEVTIPNSVTSIGSGAFYYCSGLTSVTIPNSVTSISDYAFYECSSLKSVSIPNSVTSIGEEAFSDCTAMTKLYSKAIVPPTCGKNAFYNIDKSNCELYVPQASIADYQAAEQWKEFFFIKDIESGIEDVFVEEVAVTVEYGKIVVKNVTGIVTIYNLNGIAVASEIANGNEVRFDNLTPGVYIVVVNNKSVKVVL